MKNDDRHFYSLMKQVPQVFRNNLCNAWEAVRLKYEVQSHKMPAPVWRQETFKISGAEAWEVIKRVLDVNHKHAPISVYIHIPFCVGEKCGFCDCISQPGTDPVVMTKFVNTLVAEIKQWARLTAVHSNPVTVVYFGGGTPNSLPDSDFKQIMQTLNDELNITPETQIAVECPAKLLNSERLDFLASMRVKRISVGIQTLEEPLRFKIGRNTGTARLLDVLAECKSRGFITTGDLIYGLPDQTLAGFINSVEQLISVGIDGLSLYRFVVSIRNQNFVNKKFNAYQKDEIFNYILFQIGHQLLTKAGYEKNHFIHFAKNDTNLYYRHLLRHEDLIAFGPTADGVLGPFQYRHPSLETYLNTKHANTSIPVLEGGIFESGHQQFVKPFTVQLMCGEVQTETINKMDLTQVIEEWEACQIVAKREDAYHLLANGSWLIHQLLNQVMEKLDHKKLLENCDSV